MKEVTILAKVLPGGKLKANVTPQYEAFMKVNEGEGVILKITCTTAKGTVLQDVYFRRVVLPCLQKGFRQSGADMTLQDTEDTIKKMCPATETYEQDENLTKYEWSELIEFSIRICAQEFGISVPEPVGA
jgi:hypothetical protein